ncbi:DUF3515 domain-containing protein [Marisediminicola senii]|uniref:DUF3515 domain-containing protein n=1 Tax=Marisediminicola senii TaxID=2711233 RepID=UPI0013ECF227|nr:DUF3515 domain-containing protein [Marisediminicola senii]
MNGIAARVSTVFARTLLASTLRRDASGILRPRTLRAAAASVGAIAMLGITGCTAAVPMEAAPDAANPTCAEVSVRLPDAIDDLELRQTDAQATGAWGDPALVLLRCGVEVPGPSTLRCVTIDGVDWLVDDSVEEYGTFTTYGRDPAVQVVVDHDTSDSNALNALAGAVGGIPADGACTTAEDVLGGGDAVLIPEAPAE